MRGMMLGRFLTTAETDHGALFTLAKSIIWSSQIQFDRKTSMAFWVTFLAYFKRLERYRSLYSGWNQTITKTLVRNSQPFSLLRSDNSATGVLTWQGLTCGFPIDGRLVVSVLGWPFEAIRAFIWARNSSLVIFGLTPLDWSFVLGG